MKHVHLLLQHYEHTISRPELLCPRFTSSPIPFDESGAVHTSETSSVVSDDSIEELDRGSNVFISCFQEKIDAIQSKHRLSDAAVKDILSTFSSILPLPNK